jgi:hypothetical protein
LVAKHPKILQNHILPKSMILTSPIMILVVCQTHPKSLLEFLGLAFTTEESLLKILANQDRDCVGTAWKSFASCRTNSTFLSPTVHNYIGHRVNALEDIVLSTDSQVPSHQHQIDCCLLSNTGNGEETTMTMPQGRQPKSGEMELKVRVKMCYM